MPRAPATGPTKSKRGLAAMSAWLHPNDPSAPAGCDGCDADLDRYRCQCDSEELCRTCRSMHRPSEDCAAAARAMLPRAGARLDAANEKIAMLNKALGTGADPALFEREYGRAEDRKQRADKAYRALLEIATGEDVATLADRLAA